MNNFIIKRLSQHYYKLIFFKLKNQNLDKIFEFCKSHFKNSATKLLKSQKIY